MYNKNNSRLSSGYISWTPNENHLLNMSVNYMRLDTRGTGSQTHVMYNQKGMQTYRFLINEQSDTKYQNLNLSTNYQYKWEKKGLLSLMYQFASLPKDVNDTYLFVEQENYNGYNQQMEQNFSSKEHTLEGDYSMFLGDKHRLNGGVKSIIRYNRNKTSLCYQNEDGNWAQVHNSDDFFAHRQHVLGLYTEYQMKSNPWNFRIGARKEWTFEDVTYKADPDKNFNTRFGDWVLSLFGSYQLSQSNSLNIYYRNNITRPSIYHLNPGASLQDPSNIFYGNPKLKSEKHHTFGGEWSYSGSSIFLSMGTTYRYSRNGIQSDYSMQPTGVMHHSFSNTGHYDEIGLSAYGSYSFCEMISTSLNAHASYRTLKGKLNGISIANHGWTGSISPILNINFPHKYYLNIYGGYHFPYITLEGSGYNFYHCGGSLNKSFLNDRLSISLTAEDFLWNTKRYHRKYHTPDFTSNASYQNYGFLFELGVVYRFNANDISVKETTKKIQNRDVLPIEGKGQL